MTRKFREWFTREIPSFLTGEYEDLKHAFLRQALKRRFDRSYGKDTVIKTHEVGRFDVIDITARHTGS